MANKEVIQVDSDAQPINPRFNAARLNDRMIDELIGVCRGVIFDGVVNEQETLALIDWLDSNREIADHWPANIIYQRISNMMVDGVLDSDEQADLLKLLVELTGSKNIIRESKSNSMSLPLCKPVPNVEFTEKSFCFTGKFVSGSRKKVEGLAVSLGGITTREPTLRTDYLVIGAVGSSDWIHSTHGRKIEKAILYREQGTGINIVSEEHWVTFLN